MLNWKLKYRISEKMQNLHPGSHQKFFELINQPNKHQFFFDTRFIRNTSNFQQVSNDTGLSEFTQNTLVDWSGHNVIGQCVIWDPTTNNFDALRKEGTGTFWDIIVIVLLLVLLYLSCSCCCYGFPLTFVFYPNYPATWHLKFNFRQI